MRGACRACAHFRPERQPSGLLSFAWSLGTADALEKNRDLERRVQVSENRQKRSLMETNHVAWPARPQVLAYCGLRDGEGIHYIHEMKNRGLICRDFRGSGR
jgi:hypothetical protein